MGIIPSYYESFGLVALESLACGTPIVATRVGGVESVVRQGLNGYVVEDNVPLLLADRIAALLSKQETGMKSADSIRASVERFGWSNIASAMIPEYRAVLTDCNIPATQYKEARSW